MSMSKHSNLTSRKMKKNLKKLTVILLSFILIDFNISCSKENEIKEPLPIEIALQSNKGLQVGVALADITPDNAINIELEGYGGPRLSTGVHDPLTARVMIINDGKSVVALVSLDLIGLFMNHIEDMKKMITEETGLQEENIFIHSIHSHSGPSMLGDDAFNGDYRAKLNRSVTNCILEAFISSEKAIALISTGNSQVKTVNRRYPQKQLANSFTTIEFQDTMHRTLSMLLNFGCHPVVLGPDNLEITADYVYYLRKKVETEKGGMALFFNSRFGDVNPPPINNAANIYARDKGTFAMAQELGEQLAQDMIYSNLNSDTLSISISTSSKTVADEQMQFTNHTHISILNLGEVQIAMIPGEPLEGFADIIETLLPGPYTLIFGQTGDAIGYIIPKNEWGTCTNSFISTCYEETLSFDISLAEKLENAYKELLNQ